MVLLSWRQVDVCSHFVTDISVVYATGVQQQGRQYNITAETQYSDCFLPRQHYSILYSATAKPEYKETIRLRGGTQLVTIRQLQDHLKAC